MDLDSNTRGEKPRVTPRSFEPICVSPRSFRVREDHLGSAKKAATAFGDDQGDTNEANNDNEEPKDEKSPLFQMLEDANQSKFSLAGGKCKCGIVYHMNQ